MRLPLEAKVHTGIGDVKHYVGDFLPATCVSKLQRGHGSVHVWSAKYGCEGRVAGS